jgi:type IV secretion system protein VirB6
LAIIPRALASILQPAIVTLATVYVMVWGYLQLTGKVEEPFITGVKRIITLVVILGGALDLWLYHDLIIDTFFNAHRGRRGRHDRHL